MFWLIALTDLLLLYYTLPCCVHSTVMQLQ